MNYLQRNPSAMLLGFQVGQAIRRMRGNGHTVTTIQQNLSQIAGRATSEYTGGGNDREKFADYAAGSFPLSLSVRLEYSISNGTHPNGNRHNKIYLYPDWRAGDFVEASLLIPEYSITYNPHELGQFRFGVSGETVTKYTEIYINDNIVKLAVNFVFGNDFKVDAICDADGNTIGFKCSGTLLYDIKRIYFSQEMVYSRESTTWSGYNYVNFNSYDDVKLVTRRIASDPIPVYE